jgi:hypothetical protein
MREKRIIRKSTSEGYRGKSALAKIIRKVKIVRSDRSRAKGITSSWERISRRRGPQQLKSWMEAKATAPLYEWKPNSLITFAIAVDSLYQPLLGGRKEGDVSRRTRRRCLG